MRVLIVEPDPGLSNIWKQHLERSGCEVIAVFTEDDAIDVIRDQEIAVILLDVVLDGGSAFAVADFAAYRQPDVNVIFVTDTTFFSDGSIFNLSSNARAMIQSATPPGDITELVKHYGQKR